MVVRGPSPGVCASWRAALSVRMRSCLPYTAGAPPGVGDRVRCAIANARASCGRARCAPRPCALDRANRFDSPLALGAPARNTVRPPAPESLLPAFEFAVTMSLYVPASGSRSTQRAGETPFPGRERVRAGCRHAPRTQRAQARRASRARRVPATSRRATAPRRRARHDVLCWRAGERRRTHGRARRTQGFPARSGRVRAAMPRARVVRP